MSETGGQHDERLIPDREVAKKYGIARETVWRWAAAGKIPKPVKSPGRGGMWRLSDVLNHIANLEVMELQETAK